MEEVLLFRPKKFFPIVDTCFSYEDIARQSCALCPWQIFGDFLGPAFPASRVQHISDPHSKLELECGPMPNVMVSLPKIGGALCSTPQSLADAHYLTAVQYTLP